MDEHILTADVIARAQFRSIVPSSRWYTAPQGKRNVPYVELTFDVSETLQGSPGDVVVVEMSVADVSPPYATASEAVEAGKRWIGERDTRWDDRDAIIFLWAVSRSGTSHWGGRPDNVQYVFTGDGNADFGNDEYSIHSQTNKVWLPATSTSSSGGQSFYLDAPSAQSSDQTISLTDMKARIAATNNKVDTTIPGHKECLQAKQRDERAGHPKLPQFISTDEVYISSGGPADTAISQIREPPSDLGGYIKWIMDGPDADLFEVTRTDNDSDPDNGYSLAVRQTRPLPQGQYVFHDAIQLPVMQPCNYIPNSRVQDTVHVTAPAGTLHEAFFDPVTATQAQSGQATVVADSTNGVLKPASFTDANGVSATIQSIAYESPATGSGQSGTESQSGTGTVEMQLTPHTGLANHVVDFIGLDGKVILSLDADDATVDAANNTLSWSVSSQSWENGDMLMLRMHDGLVTPAER